MKKIPLIIFSAILISLPLISLAAGLVPCGGDGEPRCQFCHLFEMFKRVVDFLLTKIIPPLAILMIAIGGFMYVFAYLSPSQALAGGSGGPALLSQAKRLLTSVVFGLIVIFGAWLIVNVFFQMIGVQKWTRLTDDPATSEVEGWWKIDCPTTGSQQLSNVSQADAQRVLSNAVANQFQNPGNSVLSANELRDLQQSFDAWTSTGNQPNWASIGASSGQPLGDIYNKAQSINPSGTNQNQMDTMQSLSSFMSQMQTFNSGSAQNNFGFMSNLANSLNYNQGLVAQSQGTSFSSAGQSVSPGINITNITGQTQTADGRTIISGWTSDGLKAYSVTQNGVTTMSAMDTNGNLIKMTTIDQMGNVQNLTGSFDQYGNVLLTGNGSQSFSGNLSAANLGDINSSMSSFLGQMSGMSNIFNSGSMPTMGNMSSLFNSAQGFQNSMFAGLNNTPQSITNLAGMNNMSIPQMSSLFNNTLLGNMNFIASQSNGSSFSSPSSLSSMFGQTMGNTFNTSGMSGMSQMFMQNNIGSMQNLMNSSNYGNLLDTSQGQQLLQTLWQVQTSAKNSFNGQPDQFLVTKALSQFTGLQQLPQYQNVISSPQMFNAIGMSSPASSLFNNSILGNMNFIASQPMMGNSFASPSSLSSMFGQAAGSGMNIPGMSNMSQMFPSNMVGPMQNLMNNPAYGQLTATPQAQQLLQTMRQIQMSPQGLGNSALQSTLMNQFGALQQLQQYKTLFGYMDTSNLIDSAKNAYPIRSDIFGNIQSPTEFSPAESWTQGYGMDQMFGIGGQSMFDDSSNFNSGDYYYQTYGYEGMGSDTGSDYGDYYYNYGYEGYDWGGYDYGMYGYEGYDSGSFDYGGYDYGGYDYGGYDSGGGSFDFYNVDY